MPPGIHRANAAERAIRTFKNHMIAGISTTDPIITLNLLRASRINPRLSAYAQVFGNFSFNDTPLAPPGCHMMVHEKPHQQQSWAPHAVDAWYTGPALSHYRCYKVHIWATRKEHVTDTLTWLPKTVAYPQLTPTEAIIQCTSQIATAVKQLHQLHPTTSITENEEQIQALRQFHDILGTIPLAPTLTKRTIEAANLQPARFTRVDTVQPVIPAPEPRVVADPPPMPRPAIEPTYLQEPPILPIPAPPRRSSRKKRPT